MKFTKIKKALKREVLVYEGNSVEDNVSFTLKEIFLYSLLAPFILITIRLYLTMIILTLQ